MTVSLSTANWVSVCSVDDIPIRGGRRLAVGSLELALFRTSHGSVMVTENRCPHKGGLLSEGLMTGHSVVCPLHGWKIDLITGEAAAPDKGCIHRYPVDLRDGQVYVDIGAGAPPPACTPIADITGLHPDSKRPKLGRRRAQPHDFVIHDFDREIPVLAVEPASPDTRETLRLSISSDDGPLAEFSCDDLINRFPVVEQPAHITCLMFGVTRPVIWTGVRLADVLAGMNLDPYPFVSFYSWDTLATKEGERFFEPLPREYTLDPRTLLVFGMNGEPLPKEHGGPLRLAVPFLQGYKSVKWLTWIKLCRTDEIGYKKRHGFIEFPEFNPPEGYHPASAGPGPEAAS